MHLASNHGAKNSGGRRGGRRGVGLGLGLGSGSGLVLGLGNRPYTHIYTHTYIPSLSLDNEVGVFISISAYKDGVQAHCIVIPRAALESFFSRAEINTEVSYYYIHKVVRKKLIHSRS